VLAVRYSATMYKLFGSNFEITIDAGCVIIKQTNPQAGQITLHANEVNSMLFGMLNRAAEEAKRLASLPRVVRAESFQRIARHWNRLSWAKVASGVVASNKKNRRGTHSKLSAPASP